MLLVSMLSVAFLAAPVASHPMLRHVGAHSINHTWHADELDPNWPGQIPTTNNSNSSSNQLILNIQFDANPEEISWRLQQYIISNFTDFEDDNGSLFVSNTSTAVIRAEISIIGARNYSYWETVVEEFSGNSSYANQLVSYPPVVLSEDTYYRFAVDDRSKDGMCCGTGANGWLTLTDVNGVVWFLPGQLLVIDNITVDMYVDVNGTVSVIGGEPEDTWMESPMMNHSSVPGQTNLSESPAGLPPTNLPVPPTSESSNVPSNPPTLERTLRPTLLAPTPSPTINPTVGFPTTLQPTPTPRPTLQPLGLPTSNTITILITPQPTAAPTTLSPTIAPSAQPTQQPTQPAPPSTPRPTMAAVNPYTCLDVSKVDFRLVETPLYEGVFTINSVPTSITCVMTGCLGQDGLFDSDYNFRMPGGGSSLCNDPKTARVNGVNVEIRVTALLPGTDDINLQCTCS